LLCGPCWSQDIRRLFILNNKSLKSKALNSVAWSVVDRFATSGIQFVLNIIIARLLLPADYGLIAMLAIFIALAQSLVDSGFNVALIQKKNVEEKDLSTVFYFNIASGIVIYATLYFSSNLIAEFYNIPLLSILAKVIGINILINSLVLVHRTILAKKLDFKKQAIINIISTIISGGTGITAAFMGYGVWALVIQTLTRNALITILFWSLNTWCPSLVFSFSSIKSLFRFGSRMLVAGILNVIFDNLYLITIGKFYSAKELGYYSRAVQFNQFPASSVSSIVQQVFLPIFSKIQDEDERIISAYRRMLKLVAFVMFPLMICLGAVAKPLILLLLTEKWLPVAPLLQILVLIGMMYPIHSLNLNLLNVKGRSDLFLRLEVIKKIFIVIAVIITIPYGLMAVVIGQVIISILGFFLNTYYTNQIFGYGPFRQIKDFAPYLVLAMIMGLLAYLITTIVSNLALSLLISITFSLIFYISISYFMKSEELKETINILTKGRLILARDEK